MFNSIEKENLSKRIIGAIKNHILQNGLMPGDRLATEREMAEAFGMSRASVREAVKILEAIGVLEARPKHGISVREFDPQALIKYLSFIPSINKKTIIEMYELRRAVDIGIVEMVIERVTEDQLESDAEGVKTSCRVLHARLGVSLCDLRSNRKSGDSGSWTGGC